MIKLLLIESPGKLRKLAQILGREWIIKASMGHVRELANDGEDSLGFDLSGDTIPCRYEARGSRGKKVLAELRQAVKQSDQVYIATDPDREGETIGWHLQQALRLKNPHRVTYSEITPQAVKAAVSKPRKLDQSLVAAGRARDCLDKLVGYKGSKHVVWKLNNGAKSMGRVQSATLHLLCQREREILAFKPQDYWSVWVEYGEGFKAFYRASGKPKAVHPKEPTDAPGDKKVPESDRVTTQAEADRVVEIARNNPHHVFSVEGKTAQQSAPPPFITSTLQQAAGQKLKFSPDKTMKVAQSLYEAGHITYMRTDSVMLADSFCQAVRSYLQTHDPQNLPAKAKKYKSKGNAQEAHEAIRPTDVHQTPDSLNVSGDDAKLYELIWNRTVATQCKPAELQKTRVMTQAADTRWEARGQVVTFAGYTKYWNNLSADSQLPVLKKGQVLKLKKADSEQKQTQPPPRYSEPKLVQLMERKGIGRPSTYAPTVKTLKERDYVGVLKGKLQPTALGLELDGALEQLLPDLIQPEFTAQMEAELDQIAEGQKDWEVYLNGWHRSYFAPALDQAAKKIGTEVVVSQSGDGRKSTGRKGAKNQSVPAKLTKFNCPKCKEKMGKVPSKSKKLKADHFLKCSSEACGAVMFWNPQGKKYELPYAERPVDPEAFTNHPCPVCGALLEKYRYTKEGKQKEMLRCSIFEHRKGKCKEVAYFQGREGFWSPKFGNLEVAST
ncbi:type I DNA topoisomerase [filamentous cyanobacterium LEGE 11480]|uniref:DNA topoisomerase 1 n=1 Tax=Romeriopsis navalis LEGE 11480 TaxID=2777977 RepID=A0A928VM84_9CYAN|nr:type I DNA topoisomerase [Romeriopsis navalis]MBE9028957.1 type I DNA topoisomerase [Romeriopsis navalis LEGE 11480]